jgi:hypothetical protein
MEAFIRPNNGKKRAVMNTIESNTVGSMQTNHRNYEVDGLISGTVTFNI